MDWGSAPQWAGFVVSFLAFLFSLFAAWRAINRAREQKTDAELKELDTRVSRMEGAVAHLPTHDQWTAMHATISRTESGVKGIGKSLDDMRQLVNQLVENELHEGREAKRRTS